MVNIKTTYKGFLTPTFPDGRSGCRFNIGNVVVRNDEVMYLKFLYGDFTDSFLPALKCFLIDTPRSADRYRREPE